MMYPMPSSCQIKNLAEIYEFVFKEKTDGFFVDVGAYDGFEWSNTWALSEAGWEGICIEPYPMYAEKCMNKHNQAGHKVTTIQCAVGNANCRCNMFLDPTGCSHTIDEETSIRSPWGFQYDGSKLEIDCFTLDFILDKMIKTTKHIDVLNIDVEGAELKVLEGFSLNKRNPTLLIIETHLGQAGKDFHAKEIYDLLNFFGYSEIQSDGLNSIFKI